MKLKLAHSALLFLLAAAPALAATLTVTDSNTGVSMGGSTPSFTDYDTVVFQMTSAAPGNLGFTNGVYDVNVVLTDTDTSDDVTQGLFINNGTSGTTHFIGSLSGNGDLTKTGAPTNFHLLFTGDASNYTGDIHMHSSNNLFLEFGGQSVKWTTNSLYTASNPMTATVANNSTATKGVSGTGDIIFESNNGANVLVYNYSTGKKVYVTNKIIRGGDTANFSAGQNGPVVELAGSDNVIFTKQVNLKTLYITGTALATETQTGAVVTFDSTASSTLEGMEGTAQKLEKKSSGTLTVSAGAAKFKELWLGNGTLVLKGTDSGTLYSEVEKVTFGTNGGALSVANGETVQLNLSQSLGGDKKISAHALTITALPSAATRSADATGTVSLRNIQIRGNSTIIANSDTGKISGAYLNVDDGSFSIKGMDLTESSVHIGSTGTLNNNGSNSDQNITFGTISIDAGGALQETSNGTNYLKGTTSITLNTLTASDVLTVDSSSLTETNTTEYTFFSTDKLEGLLNASNAKLTVSLDLTSSDLLGNSEHVAIQFLGLTVAESLNLTKDNFSISYGDWVYDGWGTAADTGNVVLFLSAPATTESIPEPTTATLSLLAFAGLAARRRRK